ncbi:MAG: RNA polymerase sigma factor RpoH [Alphaproteobacteria bacterium]|nr:MAG: RNA polymerase sigma factor RpoH [Alphaproteobacteria bacterium]
MANVPALSPDSNLSRYLAEIRKIPMLKPEEEFMLAKRWREDGDRDAAHMLVTSHLRLVAKIALGYRGYGLPVAELISEGNIGMMQAVKKFDPDKGFRLATYAMWWIRASIQEYILRSWSLVKLGTTAAQKRLFFNLRKLKSQMQAIEDGDLKPEHVEAIAQKLDVTEQDVIDMNRRLRGDQSLNAPIRTGEDGGGEWMDWLVDDASNQEETLSQHQEENERHHLLMQAMEILNDRERDIIRARRLQETPQTLDELSQKYNVSRERIRQIEEKAFEKLQTQMKMLVDARPQQFLEHKKN